MVFSLNAIFQMGSAATVPHNLDPRDWRATPLDAISENGTTGETLVPNLFDVPEWSLKGLLT